LELILAGAALDINESSLIENELTLRDLRITSEVTETRRSIVRWLALALGVISPGESRLTAVSVLDSLLYFQFSEKKDPSVEEMAEYIKTNWGEVNEKTLRYHLLQLKKTNILNNSKGKYFLVAPSMGDRYDPDLWIVKAAIKELKSR
jgi:hypothetical protein